MTQQRRRWYAVRCDSARHVIKAGVAITRLGINVFIPMHYREERQGDWMVAVENGLLFPPYLFIAMQAGSSLWGAVADVDGVDHVLGGHNRNGDPIPIAIPYQEMRKIRTKHKAGERMREVDRFKPGQRVKITAGPFTGFDGVFEKPAGERVEILVSLFGAVRPVKLSEADIKAA
jgi:transcriptional antiterminator RfaH